MTFDNLGGSDALTKRWEPLLEGISDPYRRRVTATLLENQAKCMLAERSKLNEETLTAGATTVGQIGVFQKFAFPLVRRVYPELVFNYIGSVQPMNSPTSQIFYLGHSRAGNIGGSYSEQVVYSKYNLSYRGLTSSGIGSTSGAVLPNGTFKSTGGTTGGLDGDAADAAGGFDTSNVIRAADGSPSATMGGRIASFPDTTTTFGWYVSAGERLEGTGIPEISFHIQQQAVVARTRKMRALWTVEAAQDLKAYHNLDLESELTTLLSKEVSLEIDRELIEDLRMLAYDLTGLANWDRRALDNANANSFGDTYGKSPNGDSTFTPGAWNYDFSTQLTNDTLANKPVDSNVIIVDMTSDVLSFAPRHIGDVYANLMGAINFASQDIYRTTFRGPGTVLITSPLMATFLETAAKLEGGMAREDAPTNMGQTIQYKGKVFGKYTLIVDPMYPEDEIMIAYNGTNPMDTGFVYAPYIPFMPFPTVVDPTTFQPRKGAMTRYGKAAIQPSSRFYRIVRVVGPTASYLLAPFVRQNKRDGTSTVTN